MSELLKRLQTGLSDHYTIEREVGRGGMATVYLAEDLKHHRKVAIKVLHPEIASAIGSERFLREIAIEAGLRHPHIVTLLDSGEVESLPYYVMPFVEGQSLRQRLAESLLSVAEATRLWRDVVEAIAYAHRNGIVHRDLKPENILISERHALVVDFGVAKAVRAASKFETLTNAGWAVGTPAYMSPEQAAGEEDLDERCDVYALGIVGYEMLTGEPPFAGKTIQGLLAARLVEEPKHVSTMTSGIPAELAAVVMRCLERDPGKRWQTADELLQAIEVVVPAVSSGASRGIRSIRRVSRRVAVTGVVVAGLVVTGAVYAFTQKERDAQWARDTAIPEIRRLADAMTTDSAVILASHAREIVPGERELARLWQRITLPARFKTQPDGVDIYWTSYRGDTTDWHLLGRTPLESLSVPAPRGPVALYLKFEKPGFRSAMRPIWAAERLPASPVVLDSVNTSDSEMVVVRGSPVTLFGNDGKAATVPVGSFRIDRYEVSNQDFQAFVAAGGYQFQEFWEFPFVAGGRQVSWREAMSRFTDRTGRPGPASWEAGTIPPGKEKYPVSGVSWFEAAAYARFAGKELPTIHQWRQAAYLAASSWLTPHSNIETKDLAPVGTFRGIGPYGTFDMAGNVREWCFNADGGKRYILGGSWNDVGYIFTHAITEDPFDRSAGNGIRLVRPIERDPNAVALKAPVRRSFRNYAAEQPVSDAVFRDFSRWFDYDKTPLNAAIEETDSSETGWVRQLISFDAAYGQNERVKAYLFLPKDFAPPYQTAVFFPGSNALNTRSSANFAPPMPSVLTSGRAFLHPIYKDTYERVTEGVSFGSGPNNMSGELLGPNTYRDHTVMWVKDLRRSLDYLSTRADIDTTRLAYIGFSWGGRVGAINLAVEPRFKAAVLWLPGFNFSPRRPEVDEINYVSRVRLPVVALSGTYDDVFPLETTARPFVERLGTPPEHKRHKIYSTQHFLPRDEQIRETLDWLDRYLGRVEARR